jgi:hypothetical protein
VGEPDAIDIINTSFIE